LWSEPRFLGVEVPLLLQFSIALFTGMVAATLVPPVRRSIPRPVEVAMWIALIVACIIGVTSINNPVARELTSSAVWGVDQVLSTTVGLLGTGLLGWIADNRATIAVWVAMGCGIDILAIAVLRSYRKSREGRPRVRLRDWMELPRLAPPPVQPVAVPYGIDDLSRRWAAATAVAGAAMLAGLANFSIWARDVLLPRQAERLAHAAVAGRVESRMRLESLRDAASQLQLAAHAWYAAAAAPGINGLAVKATDAVRAVRTGQRVPAEVVDVHVLLSAQSIGWYGPMRPASTVPSEEEEADASEHTGRLAS
jgi:hypothetical protein